MRPAAMTNAERRQESLEKGKCRRCDDEALPGSEYCAPHDAAQKRYQAKYLKRRRAQWKRRGLCKNDGRPRHGTSSLCAVCLTRLGRLKTSVGEKGVEKSARIAAATVVDKDGRTRYLGRRKRGAPGVGSVDRADLELAVQELIAALDGLGLYESTAGQELPRIQRQDLRQAYVGRAFASARAALDVCRRAGWTIPGLDSEDDDEPDIAATGRKDRR